ncbi:EpsG family protein [Bacillus sp. AFS029533]|uniref:EpsG family protein n=1 Tax=Bacillus sp. AFS029533 TaxID=2033494 RepID=UPI000BFCB833|nr:EpsG family protein [Bacillus sp. AFS029533]PGZ91711.1 hypothetical protein COE53_13630 [Bacillus sp. AFS029533]
MTIYILSLFFIMLAGIALKPNRSLKRRKYFIIFSFGLITVISMLRKYTVGIDLSDHYYNNFIKYQTWSWDSADNSIYEAGYFYFNKAIAIFSSNPQSIIIVTSVLSFAIIGWFIYKNSEDVLMSTFLVIANNMWFMYLNIIRQAIAVSIVLIGLEFLKNKNLKWKRYVIFLFFVFLATSFHNTAILALLFIAIDKLKFKGIQLFITVIVTGIIAATYNQIFIIFSKLLGQHKDYLSLYSTTEGYLTPTSIYGVAFPLGMFILGYLFIVVIKKNIANRGTSLPDDKSYSIYSNDFLMYACLILSILRLFSLRSNIISRVGYYFLPLFYIYVPLVLKNIPDRYLKFLIKSSCYIFIFVAFIWIGFKSASELYGTVPYEFFWE